MSTRDVLAVGGAIVGFVVGGPQGAQYGFMLGSMVGGIVDPPPGPDPGDLSAPKINGGTPMFRGHGYFPATANPIWVSDFTANESGGKGSAPGTVSYTVDAIFQLCDNTNVEALLKVFVNKKLVYTAHADSDAESLEASLTTDAWESIELATGADAQLPFAPYEDAEGAGNAEAHRGYTTLRIRGLNCGGSKTLPLVETELATNATATNTPAKTLWQGDNNVLPDESYYDLGTPDYSPELQLNVKNASTLAGNGATPRLFEGFMTYSLPEGGSTAINSVVAGYVYDTAVNLYLRFGLIYAEGELKVYFDDPAFGLSSSVTAPSGGCHFAVQVGPSGRGVWVGGIPIETTGGNQTPAAAANGRVELGPDANVGDWLVTLGETRVRAEEVYTPGVAFDPPATLDPPDIPITAYTPLSVTLKSIVDAELAKNPAIDPDDYDTTELADTQVRGYKAVGPPGQTIQELGDVFYFDLVPDAPMRFVPRGNAIAATLTNANAGVGVGQPGEVFAGLEEESDDEQSAVTGLEFLNAANLQVQGFERSDRLATDAPDITKLRTNVVLSPAEGKGRAIARNLLQAASRKRARLSLSDKHIALQPGDAITVPDEEGNSFNLLIRGMNYADFVHEVEAELYDSGALILTGITSGTYTPALTVAPAMDTTLVPMDVPLLRAEDDGAGHYTAVEGAASGTFPGAEVLRSVDDVTFEETIASHTSASNIGRVSALALASFRANRWNRFASITVNLGATGQTLASSTEAAMRADRNINVGVVGVHGRWVVIRWLTAELVSTGVYRLVGLQLGRRGTEHNVAALSVGDTFVHATQTMRRVEGAPIDLNQLRYVKAVTNGRFASSATSQAFTNTGKGLLPFSPARAFVARDASNNATFDLRRRTRHYARYGGPGGSYVPQPEEVLQFEIDVYADDTFASVVRTLSSAPGSSEVTYSAADQTSDGFTPGDNFAIRAYQLSAVVGRGRYLELDAA